MSVMAEQNVRVTRIVNQRSEVFSGPVPDPDSLRKYELIQAGFADRLLKLAEEEQQHRQELNRLIIQNEIQIQQKADRNFKLGQWFAILAITQVVVLCGLAFFWGYPSASRDIAVIVIVALASVFLGKGLKSNNPQ